MREFFSDIFGNEKIKSSLGKSITDNTLAHAYIIEGPKGSGKKMLSYRIAAALACENKKNSNSALPCMCCEGCKKVLSKNSPDVYFLERENGKATITIDPIREMRSDMFLSSSESEYKVYIVNEAHLMNDAAQNALLKVLEEPPENVLTLLLCDSSDTILSTVKSRAQIIRMSLFSTDDMKKHLLKDNKTAISFYNNSKNNFLIALEASQGSIGKALSLMNPKEMSGVLKERKIVDGIIGAITEKEDFVKLRDLFVALPSKRNELIDELSLLYTAIRDLILLKKSENIPLIYYYDRESATSLSKKVGINRLYSISDTVFASIESLQMNSNITLTINHLLNQIKNN